MGGRELRWAVGAARAGEESQISGLKGDYFISYQNKGKLGDDSEGNSMRNLESSVKGLLILSMNFGATSPHCCSPIFDLEQFT